MKKKQRITLFLILARCDQAAVGFKNNGKEIQQSLNPLLVAKEKRLTNHLKKKA
nr:hypothetical protein [Bacillus pumilus]